MKKNITIHFIPPPDNERTHVVRKNIQQFYQEVLTAYINNLTCCYADKKHIAEYIVSAIRASK